MIRQPAALLWLSYAWLAEASLFVRFFRAFFFDIAKTGGPGTGGLLLMVPFALGAILLAPLCFFLAFGLHQGTGLWLIRLFSGVGLGIGVGLTALLAFPVVLIVGILLLVLFFSGYWLEALALVGLPVLLIATVLITSGTDVRAWLDAARAGQGEAPGLLHFLRATAVALAIFFVLPAALTWSRSQAAAIAARNQPPPLSYQEQAALAQKLEAAIGADDPAPLAAPAVWKSSFFLPFASTSGDALQLAIGLRKPAAVRALAAQKSAHELSFYGGDALRYGDAEVWKALAAAGLKLSAEETAAGALERQQTDGLAAVLAAGADKEPLLERAVLCGWLQEQEAMVAFLLDHGADANAQTNRKLRDLPHQPLLVAALQGGKPAIVRRLVAAGADPARKGSDGASALDALAAMQDASPELRAALQRKGP